MYSDIYTSPGKNYVNQNLGLVFFGLHFLHRPSAGLDFTQADILHYHYNRKYTERVDTCCKVVRLNRTPSRTTTT